MCGCFCYVKYERGLSRIIIQSSGERVVLQLWWCIFDICLDGSGCLFVLERASSFALALHWRCRWRHRGKCRWLVTPEPHRHQLTSTDNYCYIITTTTQPLHTTAFHQPPGLYHHINTISLTGKSRHSSYLSNLTQYRQHGSRGHYDRVRATIL